MAADTQLYQLQTTHKSYCCMQYVSRLWHPDCSTPLLDSDMKYRDFG